MKTVPQEEIRVLHEAVAGILAAFTQAAGLSAGDFGQVEEAGRVAISALRTALMSAGLRLSAGGSRRTYRCPGCSSALHGWGLSARRVVTAEGEASYSPVRYRCTACGEDYYPLEEANGLSGSQFTTGAKAVIAEGAAEDPYAEVASTLTDERGVSVSPKEVDRTVREVASWRREEEAALVRAVFGEDAAVARAVGEDLLADAPALHGPTVWPQGVPALLSADGAMARSTTKGAEGLEWFECRAGLLAPVIASDAPRSYGPNTVYAGGVCTPDHLFDQLGAVFRQRVPSGCRAVFVGDGARWIWERVRLYFPEAVQVLDYYHASEHVGSAAAAWLGDGRAKALAWKEQAKTDLLSDGGAVRVIRDLLVALRDPKGVANPDALRAEVRYLFIHRNRMRYHALKKRGLPIGSGAMESGIKQLTVSRLRQPGMKWTRAGANAVLSVRAAHLSGSLRLTAKRKHQTLKETVRTRYAG